MRALDFKLISDLLIYMNEREKKNKYIRYLKLIYIISRRMDYSLNNTYKNV